MNTIPSKHIFDWRGYTIAVTYDPNWLSGGSGLTVAHLEVKTINPSRAPLPFTETGYRSQFLHPDEVAAEGGPVGYVTAWLSAAAKGRDWRATHAATHQLDLFGGG